MVYAESELPLGGGQVLLVGIVGPRPRERGYVCVGSFELALAVGRFRRGRDGLHRASAITVDLPRTQPSLDVCSPRAGETGVRLSAELGDWNRDGEPEVAAVTRMQGVEDYFEIEATTLSIVEMTEIPRQLFTADLGYSSPLATPACYDGDDPDEDCPLRRDDTADLEWIDRGPSVAFDLKLTVHDRMPDCAGRVHPIHRRGEDGSCVQERVFAWSSRRATWAPRRGSTAEAYAILGPAGTDEGRVRGRVEELASELRIVGVRGTRVVASDDIDGLRPGLLVALFGVCTNRETAEMVVRSWPRRIRESAYVRPIATWPTADDCPQEQAAGAR